MAGFILTPQAQRELLKLWRYIDQNNGEATANSVLRKINRKLEALAQHPGIGRPRDELAEGLRSLPANPYLIFYFPIEDGIEVVHVIHGRQDIDAIFEEEDQV